MVISSPIRNGHCCQSYQARKIWRKAFCLRVTNTFSANRPCKTYSKCRRIKDFYSAHPIYPLQLFLRWQERAREKNWNFQMFKIQDYKKQDFFLCIGKVVTAHSPTAFDCIVNKILVWVILDFRCIEILAGRPVEKLKLRWRTLRMVMAGHRMKWYAHVLKRKGKHAVVL